jgi:hypothetical protein
VKILTWLSSPEGDSFFYKMKWCVLFLPRYWWSFCHCIRKWRGKGISGIYLPKTQAIASIHLCILRNHSNCGWYCVAVYGLWAVLERWVVRHGSFNSSAWSCMGR